MLVCFSAGVLGDSVFWDAVCLSWTPDTDVVVPPILMLSYPRYWCRTPGICSLACIILFIILFIVLFVLIMWYCGIGHRSSLYITSYTYPRTLDMHTLVPYYIYTLVPYYIIVLPTVSVPSYPILFLVPYYMHIMGTDHVIFAIQKLTYWPLPIPHFQRNVFLADNFFWVTLGGLFSPCAPTREIKSKDLSIPIPRRLPPAATTDLTVYSLSQLLDRWKQGWVGNYEYLLALNRLAGRRINDPNHHPVTTK